MTTFSVNELARQITITVKFKGTREFTWRLKIAKFLFWLGATIAWMNIEFENDLTGCEEQQGANNNEHHR